MRPVEITIKGLHSFREKQTVDFSSLCEGGVFGIFGPTGSGKSSLLDAMTLALYGKVERALNNTQGIINQAENSLSVSFTFELGHKGNSSTYLVERKFIRTNEFNVKTSVCRLLDITKEPSVIADKTNDVNKQIESMLGLAIEDFTRAVVLPQGKFSEFLKLRGNERRKMLQRLFHLEKYGDELIKKIKSQLQHVMHEKEKAEAEQLGLGEASKEAIKKAEEQFHYWEKELKKTLITKEQTEEKWEEIKQLRAWQNELEKAEQHLKDLEKQKDQIETFKNYIEESSEAESLFPFAEACLLAENEYNKWSKRAKEAADAFADLTAKKEDMDSKWEHFQTEKVKKDKELASFQQSIDKAEEVEKEIAQITKEKHDADTNLQSLTKELETQQKEADKINANLIKYTEAVNKLQEQQTELFISWEEKNKVFKAATEKQHIQHIHENLESLKKEELQRKKQTDKAYDEKVKAEHHLHKSQETLNTRFSQVLYWYNKTAEDKGWIEEYIYNLQKYLKEQTDKENELKVREMTSHLVSQLKDGEPCPVCGSFDHPKPAVLQGTVENTKERFREREKVEKWISTLQHYQLTMNQREWKLQQLSSSIIGNIQEETGASLAQEEEENKITFNKDKEWDKKLQRKLAQWDREEETLSHLQKSIENELNRFLEAKEKKKQQEFEYKSESKIYKESVDKRIAVENEWNKALQLWEENYPFYSFKVLDERYETFQRNEEKLDHLQNRIEDGKKYIEKLQAAYNDLLNKTHALEVKQTQAKTQVEQLCSFIKDKKTQLEAILQGRDLKSLNKFVNNETENWENEEEKFKTGLEKLRTEKYQKEREKAIADHSYKESVTRLKKSQMDWDKKTESSKKQLSPSEVKQRILNEEQKEFYLKEIDKFEQEKEKWKRTKQELLHKLSNRYITDSEWENWKQTWYAINTQLDEIRENRGAAFKSLEEIKQKHERYQELEQKRKKWQEKENYYKQLDAVFRGKGFVEFLAEEQLNQVSRLASERLHSLTNGRYAIEVDSNGGFIIRDDANGGIKRPVSTLSGGETFLTSLALALALSASIQLKGQYPLEFFFLDEGFGTLDQELLETVMNALEKLQTNYLSVGIISHVPQLQERLPRKLFVKPAEPGGAGSRVYMKGM
ncbi:AAA family ATPase [Alteribacillus sp. JSM 102045]|uniref:AAA family ATPase n=1 Tax=Alteribacillus sp. JSM 102045 TaxID=1562101 RepID=UPI0035BF9B6B